MITIFLAYFLIASYFLMERYLRQGAEALSLQPTNLDSGSSRLMWSLGLLNLLVILLAPIINNYAIGYLSNYFAGWLGILLMVLGITLRYLAAQTLGQFYTRTLRIIPEHQIISKGIYSLIRHPGYLGTFLMMLGVGLAVNNWLIFLFITLTETIVRIYRIYIEEKMLEAFFREEYKVYRKKTWRLIPLIF